MTPDFLTLEDVLDIHTRQLARFGGGEGMRDLGLLESALAQPQATFGGEYVHQNLWEMAAAYLFHICKNHPFVDGNKRAALAVTIAFLEMNDLRLDAPNRTLGDMVLGIAEGSVTKADASVFLEKHAGPRHR